VSFSGSKTRATFNNAIRNEQPAHQRWFNYFPDKLKELKGRLLSKKTGGDGHATRISYRQLIAR